MLMSNEFVRAEDKYRRERLQDQRQKRIGKVGKFVTVLAVGALVLAACGIPAESEAGAVNVSPILADPGPSWQPSLDAINPSLGAPLPIEFGGMPAPIGDPIRKASQDPEFGPAEAPQGHPNYGRLESYLGNETQTGPR